MNNLHPADVLFWAMDRQDAKERGDFTEADRLRIKIDCAGYNIKDSKNGFELEKK